jgi:hypothetical protein
MPAELHQLPFRQCLLIVAEWAAIPPLVLLTVAE